MPLGNRTRVLYTEGVDKTTPSKLRPSLYRKFYTLEDDATPPGDLTSEIKLIRVLLARRSITTHDSRVPIHDFLSP